MDQAAPTEAPEGQPVPQPARRARQGWEEHAKQIAADGEDRLLDAEFLTPTQWDLEEWEW